MMESNDQVKCTVCKTTPAAPRLFPCGHVICAKCLAHMIRNRYEADGNPKPSKQTHCPNCRKSFNISAGSLENLPVEKSAEVKSSPSIETEITKQEKPIEERRPTEGIAFTVSSKDMLPGVKPQSKVINRNSDSVSSCSEKSHESGSGIVERLKAEVTKEDCTKPDVMTGNVIQDGVTLKNESQSKDELPVIDVVTKQTEILKTFSVDLSRDEEDEDVLSQNGGKIPMSGLEDNPYGDDDEFDVHNSESSYEEEQHGRAEVTNLCSICRLSNSYVSASGYCVSCGCLVCAACRKTHQRHAPDRKHVIVELADDNLRSVLCRSHDQLIRFFCIPCCVPVCKACLLEQHTQHRMTDYTTAGRQDNTIATLAWHVQGLIKELLAQKRALAKAYEATEANRRQTNAAIIRSIDAQIRHLQDKRQELVDKSDAYHGVVKENIHAVERQVDRATAVMQQLQQKIDTSMYPLPPHRHVVPSVFPVHVIQKIFSGIPLPVRDHRDFGVTDCEYTPAGLPDSGSLRMGLPVSTTDLTEVNQSRQRRTAKVKVVWNKSAQAHDVHFLSNSKDLLFTDVAKGQTLHKLNCDGKLAPLFVGLSTFAGRQCVFGVNRYTGYKVMGYKPEAKSSDIVLTVFDNDVNSTDVDLIGATLPPGYVTLVSLTLTRSGLIVAVVSDDVDADGPTKTALCCYNHDGQLVWQRNTCPSGRAGDLVRPMFVLTDKLDRLLVSDRGASKINIYTFDGSHVLSFPSPDPEKAGLEPTGICLDSRGRILVSFYNLKVVSLFTANGHLIRHVVQTVGPPLGLSLCDEDRYLVVAIEGHGLWLYNLLDYD